MTDTQKIRLIRQEIIAENSNIRAKYSWLQYQDTIGLLLLCLSASLILASWYGWQTGSLSAWFVVPFCAILMSILHELEHDLIHNLYFPTRKFVQNTMLLLVWLFRPTTANPWIRRSIHIHHHQHSGTTIDYEEIAVTNGERWGLLRLLITADLVLAYALRLPRWLRERNTTRAAYTKEDWAMVQRATWLGMLPLGIPVHLVWYTWLVLKASTVIGMSLAPFWEMNVWWIEPIAVLWVAPNILRQFCLHFITSNMHYFGDVEAGNILQQTQVLNAWWTFPLQLFCCNFGSTHAIHHFVVQEPFYIRQLSATRAHEAMRNNGVRFNDLGTFRRANRYRFEPSEKAVK